MHGTRFLQKLLLAGVCLFAAAPLLRALDGTDSFVIDLPFQANEATPLWLGHPETPPTAFATLDLPVTPPDPNASLLVTVFFQEKDGGFLRISWEGAGGAQVLSENFYEGTGIGNQRSLLIAPGTLSGEGKLVFQCGDSTLGISRIKLEWLESKTALVSPEVPDLLVTPSNRLTQPAGNMDGQPPVPDSAAWSNQIVTVPMIDQPMRIEEGVEFSVQIDQVPGSGRLALKESGLSWGKHFVVWINQLRAGTITPAVPDLLDDGFLTDAPKIYAGWRDGSFYVPVSLLKIGVNTVQFSSEDEAPSTNGNADDPAAAPEPLAIKDFVLQLDYPALARPQDPAQTPDDPPLPQLHLDASGQLTDPASSTDPTGPLPSAPSISNPPTP